MILLQIYPFLGEIMDERGGHIFINIAPTGTKLWRQFSCYNSFVS